MKLDEKIKESLLFLENSFKELASKRKINDSFIVYTGSSDKKSFNVISVEIGEFGPSERLTLSEKLKKRIKDEGMKPLYTVYVSEAVAAPYDKTKPDGGLSQAIDVLVFSVRDKRGRELFNVYKISKNRKLELMENISYDWYEPNAKGDDISPNSLFWE